MRLGDWLKSNKITLTAFASTLGVSVPTMHGWVHGRRMPRLEDAIRIETITLGAVRPSDFLRRSDPASAEPADGEVV